MGAKRGQIGRTAAKASGADRRIDRWVTVADDQIYERYQAKAIDECNALGHDIAEWLTEAHPGAAPVLGTGHPLADIMLVKHRPMPAEVQEGVAFFGRAGQAILKSLQRLRIDPLMLYGTTCTKAAIEPGADDLEHARAWLTRELHITQPRIVVTLGDDARAFLDSIAFPLADPCEGAVGEITRFTPTIETLAVPDIDRCLDDSASKQAFWDAFKVLGTWYENLPPY
jgi:uracil-DNA glycosylase